jgi:hypothetical protein
MMLRAALNATRVPQRAVTAHTETIEGQCTVALLVQGRDRFTVVYGEEIKRDLSYAEAAMAYGSALMHSLACAGELEAA